MKFKIHSKRRSVEIFDIRDFIEMVFGLVVGLLFFLGGSELWNIGAILNDWFVILLIFVNMFLIYGIMKLISGRAKKEALFLESVKYPLHRTIFIYIIGFIFSFITINSLSGTGILNKFVVASVSGFIPLTVRIAIFANVIATVMATTVDLSILE